MDKKQLFEKIDKIILKTRDCVDDYVVAICQIRNLIDNYVEEQEGIIKDLQKLNYEVIQTNKNLIKEKQI